LHERKGGAMSNIIVSLCLVIVLISGCHKNDVIVNAPIDINGIIPMAVGNQWNYNSFLYDSVGAVSMVNTNSYAVVGDTIINGSRWYKISNFLCANRRIGFSSLSNSGELLILKYPSSVQDSFYVNGVVNYLHVVSIDTTITISLGTFHCYAFDSHQLITPSALGGSHEIAYVSPGIGPIKLEIYVSNQNGKKQLLWGSVELSSVTTK
jgi:hypothetical protein